MLIWAVIPKWQDVFDLPGSHYMARNLSWHYNSTYSIHYIQNSEAIFVIILKNDTPVIIEWVIHSHLTGYSKTDRMLLNSMVLNICTW